MERSRTLVAVAAALAAACDPGGGGARPSARSRAAPLFSMPAPPPAEAVPGRRVVVTSRPLAAGDAVEQHLRAASRLSRSRGGRDVPIEVTVERRFRLEALAVADGVVTRARVTYLDEKEEGRTAGRSAPWTALLRGRSYLVESVDGDVRVRGQPSGAPVGWLEAERVRQDVRAQVGRAPILAAAVGGRTLESGERIDLPRSELAAALGRRASVSLAELRLIDADERAALVELHTVARLEVGGVEGDVERRELISLSVATGRVLESSARGTLSAPGAQTSGTLEESVRYDYQEEK